MEPLAYGGAVINEGLAYHRAAWSSRLEGLSGSPSINHQYANRAAGYPAIAGQDRPPQMLILDTYLHLQDLDTARRTLLRALLAERGKSKRLVVADYGLPGTAPNHLLLSLGPWDVTTESGSWYVRDLLDPDNVLGEISGAVRFRAGRSDRTRAVLLEVSVTNLVLNPVAGGASNYAAQGGASVTRSEECVLADSHSFKVVTAGSAGDGVNLTSNSLSSADTWCTFWVRGRNVPDLQISLDGSNDHAVAQIDVDGEWTRYGTLVPAAQANGSTTLYITQTGAVTETFYIDLIQVEQTAYHTSAAWGGAGPGYAWSGTEHASTSTRTASYIDLDDQVDLVSEVDQLTFRFVVRMPYSADDDWPDEALLFDVRGASDNHRIYIEYEDSDDRFHVYLNGVDRFQSSAQTFGAGDWLELVLALDFSGDAVLSIDGTQDGSADISALTAPTLTTWSLGADYNGANQANLAFGAYQVFNCVSSSAEILWMNGQDLRARWLWTSCRSAESAKLNGRRVRHVVKALLDVDGEPYPRSRDGDVAFLRVYGTSGQTTAMVDTDDQVHPTMRITPRDSKSSGFEHKMFQIVPWTPDEAITRYPVMLGPFNLTGKAQADGDDIRVYVNGEEVDRWLGGTLVSSVKVWVNLAFDAGQSATLATDIDSADSVAEIVASTDISGFPQAGALEINGELFIYTDKNSQAKRFLGVTRATRGTSAGSHTAGDTINWIQHDVVVFYGDSSLSAPTTDDDYKPAFDLDSSTNSSWVFEVFGEDDGLRVMDWEGEADNRHYTIDSETYTDNHHSDTDPWAELGCYVNPGGSYVNSWAQWTFFNPCGISSLSLTNGEFYIYQDLGYDYKQGRILSSPSGTSWTVEATYDLPDTFGSWTSASDLTAASITTGATYVRFQVRTDRTVGSTPDYTNLEYADATVGIANGPSVTSSAEIDNYSLDCTITNQTTGEAISVAAEMQVDQVLVIDTETRVVELEDGTRLASAVDPDSSRIGWLPLVDGENVILYEESGAVEVDVDLLWDRRLFE